MDNTNMKDMANGRDSVQPLCDEELEKVTGGSAKEEEEPILESSGSNNLMCSHCGTKTVHMPTQNKGWACSICGTPYKK